MAPRWRLSSIAVPDAHWQSARTLGEARVFLRDHLTSGGVLDAQLTEPLDLPDQGKNARKVSSSITLHVTWTEKQGTPAAREAEAEAEAARDEVRLRPHALEALHWRPYTGGHRAC